MWTFTDRGRKLLFEQGETELPHIHHRRVPQSWILEQLIAVNEALVTFELLSRRSEGAIELLTLRSDEMLHKMPITLELDGRRTDIVPDGWVAFGFQGGRRSFCIEVDRGTEVITKWKTKICAYVAVLSGKPSAYEQRFGFAGTTVAVVVRPKEGVRGSTAGKRLSDLKRWTEEELTALGKPAWAPVFRFTMLAPEETAPRVFRGSPSWATPYQTAMSPLWEGVL